MRKLIVLLRAAGATAAAGALLALPAAGIASAIPPGGASANTPGTSSNVSPTTVEQCGSLKYEISGYPAGETVSYKFDDGQWGPNVYGQATVGADGTVNGSIELPCDIPEGQHWVRFLASKQTDEGSLGYSQKSPVFTVVAKGAGTASAADSSGETDSSSSAGAAAAATPAAAPAAAITPAAVAPAAPAAAAAAAPATVTQTVTSILTIPVSANQPASGGGTLTINVLLLIAGVLLGGLIAALTALILLRRSATGSGGAS